MVRLPQEISKFKPLLLLLPTSFCITLNLIMFGQRYFRDWHILVFSTLLLAVFLVLLSPLQVGIANFMRKRQKTESAIVRRLLFAGFLHLSATAAVTFLILYSYSNFRIFGYVFSISDYGWAIFAGALGNIIGIATVEGIYSYHRWRETTLEAEQLSKEKLQTQLNSLLQQINPHFLFNSLNTLSALIDEDPKSAQKFLSDLSKVYRYMLRTNENELTTLSNELSFIDSYFHLIQTRFGKGVALIKDIPVSQYSLLIPPLTLQLLVENAVKHNTIGKSNPLTIEITSSGNALTIKNNLQRKNVKVESSKIGLSNIAEKYRLINNTDIEITDNGTSFEVTIPLISNS